MSVTRIVEQIDAEILDQQRQLDILTASVDRLRQARAALVEPAPPAPPTQGKPARKPAKKAAAPQRPSPASIPSGAAPPPPRKDRPKTCDVCDYTSPTGAGRVKHIQFNHPVVWEKRRASQQATTATLAEHRARGAR